MRFMDEKMRNLPVSGFRPTEIWSFVGCKQKNVTMAKIEKGRNLQETFWTWTAIDADTKLVPCWMIGMP